MAKKDNGGPAFPRMGGVYEGPNSREWVEPQSGMSLRDYFAGQALAGMLADFDTVSHLIQVVGKRGESICTGASHFAFEFADAMLAARARGE